jgi:hypothetical protein
VTYTLRRVLFGSDGHITERSSTEQRAYPAGSTTSNLRTALSTHAAPRAMAPVVEVALLASAASGPRSRPGERAT